MSGFGQTQVELSTLEGMTPEEKAALIRGEYLPERLREFERTRAGEEEMLRGQMDRAHQFATSHQQVHPQANTGTQIATLIGNALRTFGGAYMENEQQQELAKSRAASRGQFEQLMGYGEGATGAGLSTKKRGLSDALRGFGPSDDGTPYYLRRGGQ